MTTGLICAIAEEVRHLRGALTDEQPARVMGMCFYEGLLDGHRVVVVESGMGKVNAALVTTLLVDRFSCDVIVLSGVAGGVDPALAIGDVVVADRVIQHDCGRVEAGVLHRYQSGHVSFINPTDEIGYRPDAGLLRRVRDCLAGVPLPAIPESVGGSGRPCRLVFGTVLTGDQFVHCDGTRVQLHGAFGASAVEMEGGAVAQVCDTAGLPWLVVRALSDLAGSDSAMDFPRFAELVAATGAVVLRRILPVLH